MLIYVFKLAVCDIQRYGRTKNREARITTWLSSLSSILILQVSQFDIMIYFNILNENQVIFVVFFILFPQLFNFMCVILMFFFKTKKCEQSFAIYQGIDFFNKEQRSSDYNPQNLILCPGRHNSILSLQSKKLCAAISMFWRLCTSI